MLYFSCITVLLHVFASLDRTLADQVCIDNVLYHRTESLLPASGPFCVVSTSNNKEYEEVPSLQNIEQFKELGLVTPDLPLEAAREVVRQSYPDGTSPFLLPASIFGKSCTGTQQIEIGTDVSTECRPQWISFNQSECEKSEFLSAQTLFGPLVLSKRDGAATETPFRTSTGFDLLPTGWIDGSCRNVLEKADIVFVLNGSVVSDAVVTSIYYRNLSSNDFSQLNQKFSVRFVEKHSEVEESDGYNQGDFLQVRKDSTDIVYSVPSIGDCVQKSTTMIRFGIPVITGCMLKVSGCRDAQSKSRALYQSIIPSHVYSTKNTTNEPIEVIPQNITFEGSRSDALCSLIVGHTVEIIHARQGKVDNYKNVIVGILYSYKVAEVPVHKNMMLPIPFNVTFRDVTSNPIHKFASLPYFDLRLPNDVFYPFIYSSSSNSFLMLFSLLLPLILYILL